MKMIRQRRDGNYTHVRARSSPGVKCGEHTYDYGNEKSTRRRRFWRMKILMKCFVVCESRKWTMVVVVVVFPSIFSFSSSFDAVCAHKELSKKKKSSFFRKHCRNANAVYGLLIFSIHVQRQFLSPFGWCWMSSKNPFFSRYSLIPCKFFSSSSTHHPPYFLHQDFLLSRVLVILVFLQPSPLFRIYALFNWCCECSLYVGVGCGLRRKKLLLMMRGRKEIFGGGWAMCSGHMWCFSLLFQEKFMLFQTLSYSSTSSRLFNDGRASKKF